jgi:hypothetical protein
MPITFRAEHGAKVIVTTATGIVSCADILDHIQAKVVSDVLSYAELFDARDVTLDVSVAELKSIAVKSREAIGKHQPGRVAVLTDSSFIYGLAKLYASLTEKDNPQFKIFQDMDAARSWISGGLSEPMPG